MRRILPLNGGISGNRRIVSKFLFFPRSFGRDWRWLEFANIIEEYQRYQNEYGSGMIWQEVDFADNRTKHIELIEGRMEADGEKQGDLSP